MLALLLLRACINLCRKQQSRVNQIDTISRIHVRCSVVNMSTSCCFAVVLAVICLSVILLSLEADARPSGGKTSSKVRGSSTVDKVFNMVKVVASNQQQHAKQIKEIKNEIKSEANKLSNDVNGVKTLLASGAVQMNETRMEVKEMKDDMEEVVREIKDEINNEMDALRDEVKDVKRLLAQMPKQRRVSALVLRFQFKCSSAVTAVSCCMV